MPSTLANCADLLADAKRVIKNNNNMSFLYILYQLIIFIFAIIGPGLTFTALVGAFQVTFRVGYNISIAVNGVPLVLFFISCFKTKADTQIFFAQILSLFWGMLMIGVLVSIGMQIVEEGVATPNFFAPLLVFGPIFLAGFLHPQVFYNKNSTSYFIKCSLMIKEAF